VQKALASSFGVPPTVSMIDGLSLEAIRSVDEALVAFEQLVLRQDLYSAGNRLLEAFGVGEYLPRVRRLPMKEKVKVLDFVRDSNQLLSFLEMRDFGEAEKVVVRLRAAAKDFDYAKPQAAIETARTISDMRLQAARAAAVKGDQVAYASEIKAAAEIWPTNPKLRELSNMVGQNSDVQAQALMDFDRLVSQRNYRQIFNDKARFLAASINDPARQVQLSKVLNDMGEVEMVIHGATETARSSPAQAWEMVEKKARLFPDDPELTRLRADLGVKASDFVSAIEHGRQHEEKRQIGSALSWYLKARRMHPPSELARDGVQRLVEVVKNGDQPPENAPAPIETTSALNN
jgi:tetratricopeptide (TPR) repeat protein